MSQADVDRVQEFRKCIECFLCQDVCHILREHHLHDDVHRPTGFLVYVAALEMHPLDTENRVEELMKADGIGYCNITKCCTKVCPENITITDNAIIPLKERVIDRLYDPVAKLLRMFRYVVPGFEPGLYPASAGPLLGGRHGIHAQDPLAGGGGARRRERPSDIGCSTSRPRPRASVSMRSPSNRTTTTRS